MIQFLRKLIDRNSPERVNAFLAVSAGITLCLGYAFILGGIVIYEKNLTTEFIAINAALVSLATFNKVDSSKPPVKEDK